MPQKQEDDSGLLSNEDDQSSEDKEDGRERERTLGCFLFLPGWGRWGSKTSEGNGDGLEWKLLLN